MRIFAGIFDIAPREAAELGEQVKFLINPNFLWPQTSLTFPIQKTFFCKRTLVWKLFRPTFPLQFRFKQSLHLGNTDFTEQEVSHIIDDDHDGDDDENCDDNEAIPSVATYSDHLISAKYHNEKSKGWKDPGAAWEGVQGRPLPPHE